MIKMRLFPGRALTTTLLTLQERTSLGHRRATAYALATTSPYKTNLRKYQTTSLYTTKRNDGSSDVKSMSNSVKIDDDEVAAAKEAAIAFKQSSEDKAGPATVFDKILSKEWSSDKVYEDDLAYAFRDITPQAPTHILVIPKVRDGLVQLSKAREDQKALLGHLMYVAQEVGKKECPKGFRVVVNDGVDGAQSVYHLHLHVMGGRQMAWPPG